MVGNDKLATVRTAMT